MKLHRIDQPNNIINFGRSDKKDCSVVITEYKNVNNETRFSSPIAPDLAFKKLDHAITHLHRIGY